MILGTDVARTLAGPFVAACALLVVAGAGKVRRPTPARASAAAAGVRVSPSVVVAFGCVEIAAGVAGAIFGTVAALAVATDYLVLTVFAVRLLLRAPTTPCACLGSSKAVVTRTHVVLNVAALYVALIAATGGSPFAQLSGRWIAGAVFAVLVLCCVKVAILALEALPELATVAKEGTT